MQAPSRALHLGLALTPGRVFAIPRPPHMPSDNGAAIAFLAGDFDQLLRISCNGWTSRDRPPPAYESHSPRTIFSPTEGDNPSARVRQGQ